MEKGVFDHKFDIEALYHHICTLIPNFWKRKQDVLLEKCEYYENILSSSSNKDYLNSLTAVDGKLSVIQRKYYEKLRKESKEQVDAILPEIKLTEYQQGSSLFLEKFKEYDGGTKRQIVFGSCISSSVHLQENVLNRLQVIRDFIDYTKKYYPDIDLIENIKAEEQCPRCGIQLEELHTEENGMQHCPNCSCYRMVPSKTMTTSTSSSAALSEQGSTFVLPPSLQKHNKCQGYDPKERFKRLYIKYKGQQKNKLPEDLLTRIDCYCREQKLTTQEDVLERGKKTLSYQELFAVMAGIGYSQYDQVYLIKHLYYNYPLPSIDHLDDIIYLQFDIMQRVAVTKNLPEMNDWFRFFKHMEMNRVPVYLSDFRVPKLKEELEYNQSIWKIMCTESSEHGEKAGIVYIPTLFTS